MQISVQQCTDIAVKPKCPSCSKEIEVLLSLPVAGGIVNQNSVIICPYCHTLLRYSKVNYL
jgi:hypothetical protein